MKNIYTLLLFCFVLNVSYSQETFHTFRGQSTFNYNSGRANTNPSVSRGSYQTGTVRRDCNFVVIDDSRQTISCGTLSATETSIGHNISSNSLGITSYFRRKSVPSHSAARQTLTETNQCFNGDGAIFFNYGGGCDRTVNAYTIDGALDFRIQVLEFASVQTIVNVCSSDGLINLKSTDFWNRISLPTDYGDMTFSANGDASGSISGSNFNPEGLEGRYIVTGRLPFFRGVATATFEINVVANEAPNPGADISVCRYTNFNLFADSQTQTGTWSGAGAQPNGDINTSNLTPGDYTVILTRTSGVCTASTSKTLTIKDAPSQVTYPDITVCQNQGEIQLPSRVGNTSQYFLFSASSNGFIESDKISESYLINTIDFIEGEHRFLYREISASGCVMEDEFTLTLKEIPKFELGQTINICINEGEYDILLDIPQETLDLDGTFRYSGNFMAGSSTTFLPNIAGEGEHYIYYQVTNALNCTVEKRKTIVVTTDLTVVIGNADDYFLAPLDTLTVGDKSLFTSLTNGVEFEWDFGDGGSSIQKDPAYYYHTPGVYTIKLTIKNDNNCAIQVVAENKIVVLENINDIAAIDICETVEFEYEEIVIGVYPNPFDQQLNLDFSKFSDEKLNSIDLVNILMKDINGQNVLETSFEIPTNKLYTLDVSNIQSSSSLLLVSVSFNNTSVQYRLIKR